MGPGFPRGTCQWAEDPRTTRDFIDSPHFAPDFFTRSTAGICNGPHSGITGATTLHELVFSAAVMH